MPPENIPNTCLTRPHKGVAHYSALKEAAEEIFSKSCAQVASSVAPHVAHSVAHEVAPLSAGRSPIPRKSGNQKQKRHCTHGLRLRAGEIDLLREKAAVLDMSLNAYIRAKALGEDYIEKPPSWLRDVLLKLYAELAGQGNNLNQLARSVNRGLVSAENALSVADRHRASVFQLMEEVQLALAGRRPTDDY